MSKNWEVIRRQGAWAETLAELIAEAKTALKAGTAERSAVRDDLREFVDQSPNFDDSIPVQAYDELANRLHKQLVQADLEEELAKIENRRPAYSAILQQLRAITAEANQAAESISLKRVRKVVDSLAEAVESLKAIRDSIEQADDPKLVQALNDLLDAFDGLRKQVAS